jgi:nucleosome assembly protein 1-like 1
MPRLNTEEPETGASKSSKDDADLCRPAAVSEFWLTALKNQVGLSEPIVDQDAVALRYLTGLRIEPSTKSGFNLALNSHQTMFRTRRGREDCVYLEEVSYLGDSVYSWETGTEIK